MNPGQHNLSPARRAKRCALGLLACFSAAAGATYLAQLEDIPAASTEISLTRAAGSAALHSDTVIAREDERL